MKGRLGAGWCAQWPFWCPRARSLAPWSASRAPRDTLRPLEPPVRSASPRRTPPRWGPLGRQAPRGSSRRGAAGGPPRWGPCHALAAGPRRGPATAGPPAAGLGRPPPLPETPKRRYGLKAGGFTPAGPQHAPLFDEMLARPGVTCDAGACSSLGGGIWGALTCQLRVS